jgi:general L-amino acid transport system substrate-binding protein
MRCLIKSIALLVFVTVGLPAVFYSQMPADAGDTLNRIKSRGNLRCGVSDGVQGFSIKDPDGRWAGMDADFCRALAAAVLGDGEKAIFFPLKTSERFPSLMAGEIDVLVRNTTWTLEREATMEVIFAGVLYYDGQSFLVPAKSNIHDLSQLNDTTICAVKGTTHEMNLGNYFRSKNWNYQPLIVESQAKAGEALFEGRCMAFTSERPQLTAMKQKAPGGPQEYVILPVQISKEPMGPVVRRGDDAWFTLVRTVLYLLISAEEKGITRANLHSVLKESPDPAVKRVPELDRIIARGLQIQPGWAERALGTAGNYGEMFERNFGSQSVLKLERGLNRLFTQGGLMYSPPF